MKRYITPTFLFADLFFSCQVLFLLYIRPRFKKSLNVLVFYEVAVNDATQIVTWFCFSFTLCQWRHKTKSI